jgi:hypothetical protein
MTMGRTSESGLPRIGGFGTGVLIGLLLVAPVFPATSSWQSLEWTTYILFSSIALLVVAVVLKALAAIRSRRTAPAPQLPESGAKYCIDAYRIGAFDRTEAA